MATSASTGQWTVSDLSALYVEHQSSLKSQARRMLRNEADAIEVVQEAFMKFMLAAPELDSADRALAYIRTSINNLALNVIRARGTRPNLVAIDAETSQERLDEIAQENYVPVDENITAAEDAAIIRQALALLSPAERAALVMWEMEGRSTQEIASELGIKESAVRHTVSRARASLRKVLTTLVIDEEHGLTALDLLSTSYKKASELAKKSGKVAMSLVILITAVLGFNSLTGTEAIHTAITTTSPKSASDIVEPTAPVAPITKPVVKAVAKTESAQELLNELNFAEAQLESAAVMLQTLQLIEGDNN